MALSSANADLYKRIAETVVRRPAAPSAAPVASAAASGSQFGQFQPMESPQREQDWNLGQGFIDLLSMGTYSTAGLGRKLGENVDAIGRGLRSGDNLAAFGAALDFYNPLSGVVAAGQGIRDRRVWSENLTDWGVDKDVAPWAGLALDIALDPLWLVPGGIIAAPIKGTFQGARLASTATKTGVALTKPSIEAARDITRGANEVRLAGKQRPTTTQQLVGGFDQKGRVVGDQRFGEIFQGSGQNLGALSGQGLSNLVQGVKLGNAEVFANWSALRAVRKQAKDDLKAAKAAGVSAKADAVVSPGAALAREGVSEVEAPTISNEFGTVSEQQASLIDDVVQGAAETGKPQIALQDLIAPGSAAPDAATMPTDEAAQLVIRAFAGSTAKSLRDLSDKLVDQSRLVSSPVAGTRLYTPDQIVRLSDEYEKAANIRPLGALSKVTRGVVAELDQLRQVFATGNPAQIVTALAKLEDDVVRSGRVPAENAETVRTIVRETLDTPVDVTDLLEAALKSEGRPLADIPPFRPTTWTPPRGKYGKPSFSVETLQKYFPEDELLSDAVKLDIAFGRTPIEKVRAYRRGTEPKATSVARRQAQMWENFRARNFDALAAVKAQERADWLAINSVPNSQLFLRLEDGSYLGKGLLPDGFPPSAITIHNGRPVTTLGAMLDEVAKGMPVPPAIAKWLEQNIMAIRTAAIKTGVKSPRGPLSAADEDAIAERLWKRNKFVNSKADARLLAKMGPKALAQLATAPKRKFYIDAPIDRSTGLPAATVAPREGLEGSAVDVGRYIATAGRENIADEILGQGRAAIGALSEAISKGEIVGEAGQVAILTSLMRDLGIKLADNATPQQVLAQFRKEAPLRYEQITKQLETAAKAESMAPQLERVFNMAAKERLSLVKAVDKMDPADVQKELRVLIDDFADAIDDMCKAPGSQGVSINQVLGGIGGS